MRKTRPQTLLAAFCAILCAVASAPLDLPRRGLGEGVEGGGVMFAMRQTMLGRSAKKGWTNPYVTDGLVAMWDGIENAGYGVHDPDATSWVDLTGGGADWLLKDHHTPEVFEVGDDYVKILNGVSYDGRGHCTPSWASDSEIHQMEIVLDNTDFSITDVARICGLGISSGGWTSVMVIRAGNIFQSGYNKYPLIQLRSGLNSISFDRDTAIGLFHGSVTTFSKAKSGPGYVYSSPVLGAYAAQAAIGIKIKALRIYSRVLSEAEMLANYAIDKARLNLPTAS